MAERLAAMTPAEMSPAATDELFGVRPRWRMNPEDTPIFREMLAEGWPLPAGIEGAE